jgi:hypothetical protein
LKKLKTNNLTPEIMKNLLIIICLTLGIMANAQVAINTDNLPPDASAMLDVKSTTKGFLAPRMTQAQRNAIANPATGLTIFQTDVTPGLCYNAGTPALPSWKLVGSNTGQWLNNGSNIYYSLGFVGIGTTTPDAALTVANSSLSGISTQGAFQIGQSATYNLVCDNNEVLARNNGAASTLYLQYWGGDINVCASGGTASFFGPVNMYSNLNVSGRIGVKTTPSYDLHINSTAYSAEYIYSNYNGGTVSNIIAAGTTTGTWGLYAYATTVGYAAYFSGNVYCSGSYLPSDEKLKANIQPMENSLDKIMQLDVMTYNFKTTEFPELNLPANRQNGFIAQNLESIFPELVKLNPAKKEQPTEFKAVNYVGLIPVLTEAIQEQQALIEKMQKKIDELEEMIKTK